MFWWEFGKMLVLYARAFGYSIRTGYAKHLEMGIY